LSLLNLKKQEIMYKEF